MPTPGERRALLFLAAVAALGVAVRGWRELHPRSGSPPRGDSPGLDRQLDAVDSAIGRGSGTRGRGRGSPRRTVRSTDSLPSPTRIPRAPRTIARPDADTAPPDPFTLYHRRIAAAESVNARAQRALAAAHEAEVRREAAARSATLTPSPPLPPVTTPARPARVDLDVASAAEIATLPWISATLAARIVDDRERHGAFGSLEGLERVPGVGPTLARRIQDRVMFSRGPFSAPRITTFPPPRVRRPLRP